MKIFAEATENRWGEVPAAKSARTAHSFGSVPFQGYSLLNTQESAQEAFAPQNFYSGPVSQIID
jgi:hypothetical protein